MYALVDYIGNQILLKEGEKVKLPLLEWVIILSNIFFKSDASFEEISPIADLCFKIGEVPWKTSSEV